MLVYKHMQNNINLKHLHCTFPKLTEENQFYVLAIAEGLKYTQRTKKMGIDIRRQLYGFASFVVLFLGIGIYLLFRNTNMLIFEQIPKLEFFNKIYLPVKHSVFSSMLLFNLPDALWFLSGIFFIRFLWFNNKKWQVIYLISFYGIAFFIEATQLFENVPGTFDVLDLLFMSITAFVEGLLYKKLSTRRIK